VARYTLPAQMLEDTFAHLRLCGSGRRECQALWVSPWADPERLSGVVHPRHAASAVGFQVEEVWLNHFWTQLADDGLGVRVQVHTHPGPAYHSATDDAFPLIHTPGFLSLVIPRFAQGPVGFADAFLAEIQPDGGWRPVPIHHAFEVI
jgi:hypothetical protein